MDNATLYLGIGSITASLAATLFAPLIALRVQRSADEDREKRGRKTWIFKTLMGYRATRLNANFVQALNMIDIEFTAASEQDVRDAWKELLDHYTVWGAKNDGQRKVDDPKDIERSTDLLAELLVVMGKGLRYRFDKVYIKKGFYYPEGLGNIEAEQHALRRSVLGLLSGTGMKLPVALFTQDFAPLHPNATTGELPPQGLEIPRVERKPPVIQAGAEAPGAEERS